MNPEQARQIIAALHARLALVRASAEIRRQLLRQFSIALAAAQRVDPSLAGLSVQTVLGPGWRSWIEAEQATLQAEDGARALDVGTHVLLQPSDRPGRFAVVSRDALLQFLPTFLGGWQVALIVVGVAIAVLSLVVGAVLITDYITTLDTAQQQNDRFLLEAQSRAATLVGELARTNPQAAAAAAQALRGILPNNPGTPPASALGPAVAAGAAGLGIGALIALFLLARKGRR